jgi:hypothetical protein
MKNEEATSEHVYTAKEAVIAYGKAKKEYDTFLQTYSEPPPAFVFTRIKVATNPAILKVAPKREVEVGAAEINEFHVRYLRQTCGFKVESVRWQTPEDPIDFTGYIISW